MLNKLEKFAENTNIIQKLIFSVWLIIFVYSLFQMVSEFQIASRPWSFRGWGSFWMAFWALIGESLVAFILFKVWVYKKG